LSFASFSIWRQRARCGYADRAFPKNMAAGAIGDEIKILGAGWFATASSAARPGLAIGPGGKPSIK
jgi:hypothetical protein